MLIFFHHIYRQKNKTLVYIGLHIETLRKNDMASSHKDWALRRRVRRPRPIVNINSTQYATSKLHTLLKSQQMF